MPIKKHKEIKGLDPEFKNQNLRDHMTDRELIFAMLGEVSTTSITRARDAQGFVENRKVVSSDNYLEITGKVKKIEDNSKSKDRKKKLTNRN